MSELLSSLTGVALVLGVGVPLATFVAKAILAVRWRLDPDIRTHGSLLSFLLIVGPSLVTILWFVSAALHQAEPGEESGACALDHAQLDACLDSLFLALILTSVVAAALKLRWRSSPTGPREAIDARYSARLAAVCRRDANLRQLLGRVSAAEEAAHPICVRGIFRPVVEVSTAFLDRVDDDTLRAALFHERSHLSARDPLRYLLASLALTLNPLGFLLRADLRRWRAAREAVCDLEAVGASADPLSLADALVAASRLHGPVPPRAVSLTGSAAALLRLRIHLLLEYSLKPQAPARSAPRWLGAWVGVAVAMSPHVLGAWPLDTLHGAAETLLAALGLL